MVHVFALLGEGLVDIKVERERSDTPDSLAGYDLMTLGKYNQS